MWAEMKEKDIHFLSLFFMGKHKGNARGKPQRLEDNGAGDLLELHGGRTHAGHCGLRLIT